MRYHNYWHYQGYIKFLLAPLKTYVVAQVTIFVPFSLIGTIIINISGTTRTQSNCLIGTTMESYTGNIYDTLFNYKVI